MTAAVVDLRKARLRGARPSGARVWVFPAALALSLAGAGCRGGAGGPDKTTQRAIAELKSPDRDDRQAATQVLARRRGQELHAVPALIDALGDRDPMVQKSAAEALRTLLAKPDLPDSRAVWEDYWRRMKPKLEKERNLTPKERLKREKAKLKNDEAVLLMSRRDFQEAEALLLEAVAQHPENPMYWNNLGKCNANQGRWPLAVDRYLHALDEDPGYEAARYNLAEAYLEISRLTGSDRTDEALAHVEQALALDDKGVNWAARWLKARILHHMALAELNAADRVEIYKRAAEAIEEAKRLAPDAPEVRKTAALIAYGRELYYQSYKELMRLDELGYTMDPGFVGRLEQALRRRAYRMGIEPPPMPEPSSDKSPVRGVPPSLRGPYGPDGPR